MKRAMVATIVAGALLATGCSGGAVSRKAAAAIEHPRGPATRLVVERSTGLPGQPGGMATDRDGTVVHIDNRSVVAFDAEGHERWSAPVPGAALSWPWLGHGLVVVPTSSATDLGAEGSSEGATGADDSGGCVALDRESGERRWSYEEQGRSGVAVAGAGARVFCLFSRGTIVGLDVENGTVLWRNVPMSSSVITVSERTAIAVEGTTHELLFTAQVGSIYYLLARAANTGGERGSTPISTSHPVSAPVATGAGRIAVAREGESGGVCEVDLDREQAVRCLKVPAPSGFDPASIPVVAHGVLVVTARDGSVTAIDVATWKVRWTKALPTPILDSRPAIANGIVLLSDRTRVPWALRLSDGSKIDLPVAEGFVIGTATDPAGGFAVTVRGDPRGQLERWLPSP